MKIEEALSKAEIVKFKGEGDELYATVGTRSKLLHWCTMGGAILGYVPLHTILSEGWYV